MRDATVGGGFKYLFVYFNLSNGLKPPTRMSYVLLMMQTFVSSHSIYQGYQIKISH